MKKAFAWFAALVCIAGFAVSANAKEKETYCPNYSPLTVILKGTLNDDFNYNITTTAADATNCFAWENQKAKFDVFLVVCYDGVVCERCPIKLTNGVYAYLVDRNTKTVYYGELPEDAVEMICMGENNVGLHAYVFLPIGLFDIVAAGKRDCKYGLLKFDGVYGVFDTYKYFNTEVCDTANYVRAGAASVRRDDALTRKALSTTDKWCPECVPASCDNAVALLAAYVEKRYKSIKETSNGYAYEELLIP